MAYLPVTAYEVPMPGDEVEDLNSFLSGEHTLRSDVLDRLALAVEFTKGLQAVGQPPERKS